MTEPQFETYWENLNNTEARTFGYAIKELLKTHRYMPTIADIYAEVERIRKNSGRDSQSTQQQIKHEEREKEWQRAKFERRTRLQGWHRLSLDNKHALAEVFSITYPVAVNVWSDNNFDKDLIQAQMMLFDEDSDEYKDEMGEVMSIPPDGWTEQKQEQCNQRLKELLGLLPTKEKN